MRAADPPLREDSNFRPADLSLAFLDRVAPVLARLAWECIRPKMQRQNLTVAPTALTFSDLFEILRLLLSDTIVNSYDVSILKC